MTEDLDELRETVAHLRAENAALIQTHGEELDRVRQSARETVMTGALHAEAIRLGAYDPEAVVTLLDRSAVGWSEHGRPEGVDTALAAMRQARGYMFRSETLFPAGSAPKPARGSSDDMRTVPEQDYAIRKRQFLAGQI